MLYNYKAIDGAGHSNEGSIDAVSMDLAISSLQRRGLVVASIKPLKVSRRKRTITFFDRVTNRDIVILSRQIATLFEAKVAALQVFNLIAGEEDNPVVRTSIEEVASDLQGGSTISKALSRHPAVFSEFYINMVRSGEESGKLDETFNYLADYLDRNYETTSKAKNALVYPAFVIMTFIMVMLIMFTVIIPRISAILTDSGQALPLYTKIVLETSDIIINFGPFVLAGIIIGAYFLWRYIQTDIGKLAFDRFKLKVPYVGDLYKKLYLSRIADNINTLVSSGSTMLKSIEVTASVVGSIVYRQILEKSLEEVKGGKPFSATLSQYPEEIPSIMVQMTRVGEETGELANILKTLAKFYQREMVRAVDTLVGMIEPIMIVVLGLGVGILIASILVPIYNMTAAF